MQKNTTLSILVFISLSICLLTFLGINHIVLNKLESKTDWRDYWGGFQDFAAQFPPNSVASRALTGCGRDLWTLNKSITPIKVDGYRVIITKSACTKGGEYIDGQFYENGKPSTPQYMDEGYSYTAQIIASSGNIVEDYAGNGDEVSIVDTPDGFPYLTILSSTYGASNISHTYSLFSTDPTFKKITDITQPLNEWQVNRGFEGKGSERIVDGFYKDSKGNFLIDRLKEVSVLDDWKWHLETLKVVDDGIMSLGTREFNIETYQRLQR